MKKTLVKEVPFGRGLARVTVAGFTNVKRLDGVEVGEEVIITAKVEIVVNGNVVEKGNHANVLEYSRFTDTFFERAKLNPSKKYTKVGDKAITEGDQAGLAINEAIREMKEEIAAAFNTKTVEQVEKENEIAVAEYIIAKAEKEGVENLMTLAQLKAWKKRYNDFYNEGGEGYIPEKISREQYEQAVQTLNKYGE